MKILGIDYGKAKVGLALGDTGSRLSEPWKILRYTDIKILSVKIKQIVGKEKVEKIIVGVSEGKMAQESRSFGKQIGEYCNIKVDFVDETLTSADASRLSIEAGIRRNKRKGMEDAFAASLILQSYLDTIT